VVSIYALRSELEATFGSFGQVIVSIINSVQITIFNSIYFRVANLLTIRENHRTDTKFENGFVAKYFIFQVPLTPP
jgi:hypothetical protein